MLYAPQWVTSTPRHDRIALSREYSDFLIELSIALHKYGMYPSGHPSLEPAAAGVAARAGGLLADREQIGFGVARRQLVIEGVATNPSQPVLRRLAETLHRHHLGAVTIERGVSDREIGEALRVLSQEPERHGALGRQGAGARLTWPHLRLHPLSFDGLTLGGQLSTTTTASSGTGDASHGADLWVGLARAAMAAEAGELTDVPTEADVIARAIDAQPRTSAYDQVVIGYLLQIAHELKRDADANVEALRQRMADLVGALSPATLRRLVDMGGDVAQRRAFILDATQSLAVDAVLDIVKAAADVSGQTISHGLMRMLAKLGMHAEVGNDATRPMADEALREQVGRLLNGWSLADPNPEAYGAFLQKLATTRETAHPAAHHRETERVDPVRLLQMSLEIGEAGPLVDRAIAEAVRDGRAAELLSTIGGAPQDTTGVSQAVRASLVHPKVLRALLDDPAATFESLDLLEPLMTAESYDVLLDILATSDNRTIRRKLLERLTKAPVDLGPNIAARLEDPRWFVQRNMLVLLDRLGRVPDGLSLARWVSHADVRVRHEAIKLQLKLPRERVVAVRAALADGQPRLVHSGLAAIQHECPSPLADLVAAVALDANAEMELRVLAARALGRCRDRRALQTLLDLTRGRRTLLGRAKLAPRSPVMLAALQSLATGWRSEKDAASLLQLALAATDPEIQRAARGSAS